MKDNRRGFSLIEVLTVTVTLSVLMGISIYNFRVLATRAYNITARSDLQSMKRAIQALKANEGEVARSVAVRNLLGPAQMPAPFAEVVLSNGVNASMVYNVIIIPGSGARTRVQLRARHVRGDKEYRYTDINDRQVDQVVSVGAGG